MTSEERAVPRERAVAALRAAFQDAHLSGWQVGVGHIADSEEFAGRVADAIEVHPDAKAALAAWLITDRAIDAQRIVREALAATSESQPQAGLRIPVAAIERVAIAYDDMWDSADDDGILDTNKVKAMDAAVDALLAHTAKPRKPRIVCTCGHALSSHRQDPVDPWATEKCKTCGCSAFLNRDDRRQGDWDQDDLDAQAGGNFV